MTMKADVHMAVDIGRMSAVAWHGSLPGGLASVAYTAATSPSTVAGVGACAGVWYLAHGILRDHTTAVQDGSTIG